MKIYKYEILIKDNFMLMLPAGSKILSVQLQHCTPVLWAAVTNHSTIPYYFAVYGTGNKMDDAIYHKFIGTIQQQVNQIDFVWHIFQVETKFTVIDNFEEQGYF